MSDAKFEYDCFLPDHDKILEGDGRQTRYVLVRSAKDIKVCSFKKLLKESIRFKKEFAVKENWFMNKYSDRITTLLEQVRPKLSTTYQIELKNCFGAIAGYVNGRIFISCGKFGVALRLPPETLNTLFQEKDVKHLKYFSNGHIKKEYAVLPKRILEDENQFKKLADKSIKYVSSQK